jgi:glucan phosphoethanolaminetransferase (alkaline phosphatase superfamily)
MQIHETLIIIANLVVLYVVFSYQHTIRKLIRLTYQQDRADIQAIITPSMINWLFVLKIILLGSMIVYFGYTGKWELIIGYFICSIVLTAAIPLPTKLISRLLLPHVVQKMYAYPALIPLVTIMVEHKPNKFNK